MRTVKVPISNSLFYRLRLLADLRGISFEELLQQVIEKAGKSVPS